MAIKHVESAKDLTFSSRKTIAWRFVTDFTEQAKRIPAIDKITMVSRNENVGKSEWFVTLDGAPFRWIQRESFTGNQWRVTFKAIDGDFDSFEGSWLLSDVNDGIRLSLEIEFALDIPVLEIGVGDEIKNRVKVFSDSLIDAATAFCRENSIDERINTRVSIKNYSTIDINGSLFRCLVRNASRRGLLLQGVEWPSQGAIDMSVGNSRIAGTLIPELGSSRLARVVFNVDLSTTELEGLCAEIRSTAERRKERVKVEGVGELSYSNNSMAVLVHNVSTGGMFVSGSRDLIGLDSFQMCGITLKTKVIYPGPFGESWRIAFQDELSDEQFALLTNKLKVDDSADFMVYETMRSTRLASA